MIKSLFILSLILSCISLASEKFDYTKIKPEHYKDLKHNSEFTDETGNNFRILNSDSTKGLQIQVIENGKKKWKRHGAYYRFYNGKLTELITYSYGKKDGVRESYNKKGVVNFRDLYKTCLLYTSPSPRDKRQSRMPSSA